MANEIAAGYAIDDAVGALLPHASVTARYSYNHDQHGLDILGAKQTENSVGVFGNVTIPIYQGGGEEASVRQAKAQHHQAEYDIGSAKDAARQEALAAWAAYQAALSSIAAQQAQVKADQDALAGVSEEQRAGERTVVEVLNEQQELLGAETALAAARHDAVVAAYRVLSAAGLLTAGQLRLPVRLYDPRAHYNEDADKWIGFGD
jgi:outer membrane protein TolC